MSSTSTTGNVPSALRELIFLALMGALIFASKAAMAALPNIHLVAVFIALCVLTFGWKALCAVAIYVLLEGLVYGFGLWWISYLYAWPLLVLALMPLYRMGYCRTAYAFSAVICCVFGLSFGALCAIPYCFLSGIRFACSWFLAGIPWDVVHGISNGVLTALLLPPLCRLFRMLHLRKA